MILLSAGNCLPLELPCPLDAFRRKGFGRLIGRPKDLRTGVETSDTQGVLDGDLDEFLAASLSQKLGPETIVEDLD